MLVNPTIELPYRPGPVTATEPVWMVATKFTFTTRRAAILATPRALRFWAMWASVPGSLGLSIRVQPAARVTWTLTAWRSPAELDHFMGSPAHRSAVRAFANRLAGTSHRWESATFDIAQGWDEATQALGRT